MKRIAVTYRTLEPHTSGVRMVVKQAEFTARAEPSTASTCGYSMEGSSLIRFYGEQTGRRAILMVPKAEILSVEGDE